MARRHPDAAQRVAWLSLDPGDSQTATFWSYVIAALQTVIPGIGTTSIAMLREPQPPPIHSILATLVNELSATSDHVVLVLDDYHLIDAPEIQDGMAFLLEHLPPQVHVVIATRADPGFPVARLRARGELAEIRAVDLRFTADEAAAYLNDVMDLSLTSADVAALESRTEGWVAALQLAALSMQGRSDAADFIAGFTGDDRYIVDYLVEEVLERQAGPVRQFLLRTSILARLSGPSSDAVTGETGGKAMLEQLDRGNLFLVPLDDRREWYRYHHLFADVLLARLADEQPDIVPDLHRRASAWYEQHGDPPEAIHHALAAGDVEHAADLMERAMPAMRRSRQEAAMLGWLQALPDELIASRPVLSVHHAGLLLDSGRLDGAEARLQDAERWLDAATSADGRRAAPSGSRIVADEAECRRLPGCDRRLPGGTGASERRCLPPRSSTRSERSTSSAPTTTWVVDRQPDSRHSRIGRRGELDAAHAAWADAMANLESAGHLADAVSCAIALADIRIDQGRLRDAFIDLRARSASRDREPPDRGARSSGHARGHERALPRAR